MLRIAHNRRIVAVFLVLVIIITSSCQSDRLDSNQDKDATTSNGPVQIENPANNIAPGWIDDATIYEVNLRQYTKEGTFTAFAAHLPRLKEMGVKVLWFMPIHPISVINRKGTLGSYYSVADYQSVNPEFGNLQAFKDLVNTCHEMGFKIILDWVGNHTGWDNPWITEHPDWYTQVDGKIVMPEGTDWTDVADLNYDNQAMRAAMLGAMVFWVKEVDVDGFRCDVANGVPLDFWENARSELGKIKPVFMLAESGDNLNLLEKAFNANYNWNLLDLMIDAASGTESADPIRSELRRTVSEYPQGTFPMNFTTNHDENSWNGTEFERLGAAKKLMTALTFIAPGLPLIYSGQEASNHKRLLFFEKDEIDWSDLSAQSDFQKLIQLKKANKSLFCGSQGGTLTMIKTDQKSILAFAREKEESKVVFIGNFSQKSKSFKLEAADFSGSYNDYFANKQIKVETGTTLTLEGFGYLVLVA